MSGNNGWEEERRSVKVAAKGSSLRSDPKKGNIWKYYPTSPLLAELG